MRKIAEKVAIVAQICIALVFVLTTVLYMMNTIPQQENWQENGVMSVVMIVLAVVYLGISAYLLYVNFSERANLKRILLFCDSDSATRTNVKVIDNVVKGCEKQVDGIKVKKVRVRADEKGGFMAVISVRADADSVAQSVNKLRCLVDDSFKSTLGLTFNTINFEVQKLNGRYTPDVKRADELAQNLQEQQEACAKNYQQPLADTDGKDERTKKDDRFYRTADETDSDVEYLPTDND